MDTFSILSLVAYLLFAIGGVAAQYQPQRASAALVRTQTIAVALSIVLLPTVVVSWLNGLWSLVALLVILGIALGAITFLMSLFISGAGRWFLVLASAFYTLCFGVSLWFLDALAHLGPLKMW